MRAHFINNKENIIMYLPDSIRFFKINSLTQRIVKSICNGISKEEILDQFKISNEVYEKIVKLLIEQVEITTTPPDTLVKITMIVSNSCNLNCKYCYANQGKYADCVQPMTKEIAKETIDKFYSKYRVIQNLMFFGGEPTLNLDVIEFICQYLYEKKEKGEIDSLPALGMVTNGTNLNNHLIELINKYHLQITVSLDGKENVNDKMRVFINEEGTHNIIVNNIKTLQEKTKQPTMIEATYNKGHLEEGVSVLDVVKYCKDDLNVPGVHIAAVTSTEDEALMLPDMKPFEDTVEEIFLEKKENQKDYSYTSFNLVMEGLKRKVIRTHYCEAGIARFAVSAKGDVYPCYIFTDMDTFNLGNILDDNIFESEKFKKLTGDLLEYNKFSREKCGHCFNNTMCRKCIGENYFTTSDMQKVPSKDCNFSIKMTEKIISLLCD